MDKFTHLGSTLFRNVVIDDEVNARLAKASAAFGRLHKNVWNRRGITLETRIKVYQAIALTTLLYSCESCMVYQCHARKLNHFHTTCLRKLLGIKWQDKIPDTEVLRCTSLPSIYTILMQSQLCWAGHVVCMPDHWLPKRLFYGELQQGKHLPRRPEKALQRHTKSLVEGLQHQHQHLAADCTWHRKVASICSQGCKNPWSQQDSSSWAVQTDKEKQHKQIPNSSCHSLSTLPENLLDMNCPDQPSLYPQRPTPPPGWLDGPWCFQWTNEQA